MPRKGIRQRTAQQTNHVERVGYTSRVRFQLKQEFGNQLRSHQEFLAQCHRDVQGVLTLQSQGTPPVQWNIPGHQDCRL